MPVCNKFTRIDKNSMSIIDNILTTEKLSKCYIIPCSISDHFPIILEDQQKVKPLKQKLEIRSINHDSVGNFKNALLLQNWDPSHQITTQLHHIKTLNKLQEKNLRKTSHSKLSP